MNTETALLAEVLSHPEDDQPRFAYADLMEKLGETDRAEFIRIQLHRAMSQTGRDAAKLRKREDELLKRPYSGTLFRIPDSDQQKGKNTANSNRKVWAHSLRPYVSKFRYDRGFVDMVTLAPCSPEAPRYVYQGLSSDEIKKLFRLAPIQTLIDDRQLFDNAEGVANAGPAFRNLRKLAIFDIGVVRNGDDFIKLFTSKHVSGLRSLILHSEGGFPTGLIEAVFASKALSNLQELWIGGRGCGLQKKECLALAKAPHFNQLNSLGMTYSKLDPKTAKLLGKSKALANLEELDVAGCNWSPETWNIILDAPFVPNLKTVFLGQFGLKDLQPQFEERMLDGEVDMETRNPTCFNDKSWHAITWKSRP